MTLADLLRESLDVDCDEVWENERTPTPVRVFGVRLHSMGLSVREVAAVLELLGVDRSHGAVWNWTHDLADAQADPPTAEPSRVAVDEKQIEVDGEEKWLYAAIDTESKLLLEIDVYSRRGTDSAAAFLHRLTEKHDVTDAEFLVDAGGYLTALFRHDLSGQLNYKERNHIEKWFQTVSMRIDRFHSFWQGSQSSARRWLRRFRHHYNHDRPNQALNNQTPVEVVLN
jgi:putative transposase